ncbi:Panacea domain-containing protein [Bifidobacterium castoris]|uniref:Antitoxin SocA-like Panacea domain-containing protein n=1 Tax=Bifidobacterium castoris TaxID=2306972 RepID=A0A430F5D2_9BIFI|nr:type II toxin-antitoxin system antitoxin SocA domain-containing protein [Bifidobacterium castoris]RSX46085.1 hypothetical protein D2E22_1657 [Bifidobacterium castoris]
MDDVTKEEVDSLEGVGINPTYVANSILRRAFTESIPITPMKLQKLLFFVTCLYQRATRRHLLTESFQPWKYGPVCAAVYDEFKTFGAQPIDRYATDARGLATAVNEAQAPAFAGALDTVWRSMKHCGAVELSRLTHVPGSSWSKAIADHRDFIDNAVMADDHTFDCMLREPKR